MSRSTFLSLIMFIGGMFLFFFLLLPAWQDMNTARDKSAKAVEELEDWNSIIANIDQLSADYERSKDNLDKLALAIPSDSQVPELLIQLGEIAKRNGLVVSDIKFAVKGETPAEQLKNPSKIKILETNLTVEGAYPDFKKFLGDIEKNVRLTDVMSVSFSSGEKEETGSKIIKFDLVLNNYYLAAQ